VDAPQASVPSRKPAPAWAPLHGLQLSPGACCCMGSPDSAPSLRAHLPSVVWSPPWTAVWISAAAPGAPSTTTF